MAKKTTSKEKPISKTLDNIIKEAKRLEQSTLYSSKGHFTAAQTWGYIHYFLGVPITVLAALSTASVLSSLENKILIVAIFTSTTSILTALLTFLNPNDKSNQHNTAGNDFDFLNGKIRTFYTVECWQNKNVAVLTVKLGSLANEKHKLNKRSPSVSHVAYYFAKRGILKGQADFDVDDPNASNKSS